MNIVAGARNRRVRAALRVERRDRVQAQIVHFWRLICGASDWGDSRIGNPVLDLAVLNRLHGPARDALADHWLRTWKRALPGSDPEQAWHLLRPLAALRTAAVYQHFLDNIEPSERIYHEEDVRPALEIAARLAAHDSRR